uniref:Uncharacterized protein n=1 Tax=Oryza sativa subsp. japonica TaxID=39947 RepID=Q84S49_ORYSJ|nr:hypothetical protein [Oryza sativa Japonica Group]
MEFGFGGGEVITQGGSSSPAGWIPVFFTSSPLLSSAKKPTNFDRIINQSNFYIKDVSGQREVVE